MRYHHLTSFVASCLILSPPLAWAQADSQPAPATPQPPTSPTPTPTSPTAAETVVAEPAAPEPALSPATASIVTTAPPIVAPIEATPGPAAPDGLAAPADEPLSLLPFQVTTSTWSRFEGRANYDSLGVSRGRFLEGDAFFFRARLALQTNALKLSRDLKGLVQFSPQASGKYGLDGTQTEHNLGLFEGYVRLDSSVFTIDFGRFGMNYGEALIIGSLDWAQQARAFDGVRGRYKLSDKAYIDAFGTLTAPDGLSPAEGHPLVNDPLAAGDSYFWGVYAGLGALVLDKDFDLDAYVLGNSNVASNGLPNVLDATTTLNRGGATEVTFGGRMKQKISEFDYRLEAGLQTGTRPVTVVAPALGSNQNVLAWQLDGELGYNVIKQVHLTLYGAVASGDDASTTTNEGWHELYPTGHKWFGLSNVIGARTNVADAAVKVSWGINDTLKFLLDAHLFSRLQDGGLGQVGTNKLAGYEVDTQLQQRIGGPTGPFYIRGLYGLFIPNSGHYAANDLAHYVEAEGGLVF